VFDCVPIWAVFDCVEFMFVFEFGLVVLELEKEELGVVACVPAVLDVLALDVPVMFDDELKEPDAEPDALPAALNDPEVPEEDGGVVLLVPLKVLEVDELVGEVDCMPLELPNWLVEPEEGDVADELEGEVEEEVPDVDVCACSPRTAANSAEVPQVINLSGCFI
jgi:hypothetical protein